MELMRHSFYQSIGKIYILKIKEGKSMDQKEVVQVLKELAVKAGHIIMEIYETDFTVDYKDDSSPLTMADKQANACIVEGLAKHFPECAILSE